MPKVYAIDGVVPIVHPSAFVHPRAILCGDVVVGPECYIGPGASLRGDCGQIKIGTGTSIQDSCTVHSFGGGAAVIGDDVTVGHGAVLHGCRIGAGVLIGMNAVVMDGAEIGDNAFVGALAFVRAEFKVPSRMLVAGVPGKLIRPITDAEIAWKQTGVEEYRRLVRRSFASLIEVEALTEITSQAPRLALADSAKPKFMVARGG